jgi:ABC-type polysaccharide/polyol phosphate export permease
MAMASLDPHLLWQLTVSGMRRRSSDRLLGVAWWFLDPLLLVAVYALVFGDWIGLGRHADQRAYPLFIACALVPWRWFALASTQGSAAFTDQTAVLASTPVDREAVLLSQWLAATGQSLPGVVVLLACMVFHQVPLTWNLLFLPLPLLVTGLLGLGVAYLLCPLRVMLPDLGNLYDALLRLAWFLSPGVYSLSHVPESLRGIYVASNPFAGVLEGVRRPIHAGLPPDWHALFWSALWAVGLLLLGRLVFRRLAGDAVRML